MMGLGGIHKLAPQGASSSKGTLAATLSGKLYEPLRLNLIVEVQRVLEGSTTSTTSTASPTSTTPTTTAGADLNHQHHQQQARSTQESAILVETSDGCSVLLVPDPDAAVQHVVPGSSLLLEEAVLVLSPGAKGSR